MPFIQNSVGLNGINDRADVKIIAELILIAHDNQPFLSESVLNGLSKTGRLFDIAVNQAIIEFIRYARQFYEFLRNTDRLQINTILSK